MIPDRLIFLWSGTAFPLFAELAVKSALLANPSAVVELHVFGDAPDNDLRFRRTRRLARVEVHRIDLDSVFDGLDAPASRYRALFDAIDAGAASARSNLLRYAVLEKRGGVYLDFDVLCVRPFTSLAHHEAFIGEEKVWRVDEHRLAGPVRPWMIAPTLSYVTAYATRRVDARLLGGHDLDGAVMRALDAHWSVPNLNNAVIGASPGSRYLRRVLRDALEADPRIRFNLGPTLVSHSQRRDGSGVTVLPERYFYVQPPSYSFRFFEGRAFELPAEAILIHYVSSNHGKLLRSLDENTILARRNGPLFYRLAADVLDRAHSLD